MKGPPQALMSGPFGNKLIKSYHTHRNLPKLTPVERDAAALQYVKDQNEEVKTLVYESRFKPDEIKEHLSRIDKLIEQNSKFLEERAERVRIAEAERARIAEESYIETEETKRFSDFIAETDKYSNYTNRNVIDLTPILNELNNMKKMISDQNKRDIIQHGNLRSYSPGIAEFVLYPEKPSEFSHATLAPIPEVKPPVVVEKKEAQLPVSNVKSASLLKTKRKRTTLSKRMLQLSKPKATIIP